MVLESLERLCNLKPLFHAWQNQYSRANLGKNTPAKAKATQILEKLKGQGGVLKNLLEQVLLIRIPKETLKTNCKHLLTILLVSQLAKRLEKTVSQQNYC